MPVDFSRVPPRVNVPNFARPSIVGWALLLSLFVVGCATMAIFLWPGAKSDSVLFWFCAVVFPILAWSFLLSCRFAYLYVRINSALATNRICDAIETQCHESSSEPLAVLGHAWKFSSNKDENAVGALVDGKTKLCPVSSLAVPNTDVIARWLDVPDRKFYAGNALTEHARQTAVCEWLLSQMVGEITQELQKLPAHVSVMVDLCIDSMLEPAIVGEKFLSLLKHPLRTSRIVVNPSKRGLSLFHTDSWFDDMPPDRVNLLVSIQLRNAVSETLATGVAEAGSMLLVSSLSIARNIGTEPVLWLHRPSKGAAEEVVETLKLAVRWGKTSLENVGTTWRTGLSKQAVRAIRSSCQFGRDTGTVNLDTSVGRAGIGRAWLATALGIANAAATDKPQLVITQEGNDLLALVCEKQT
ncbi:hypothetical protein [Paraburkholderia sp. HP33-1]|uniref:hypothetical protein n=1 Tax=Paraburkholderia sp. HP33-1 TaxID=2883243 RepID=UPI001F2530B9|nr:hypothetical protein [Paraburkholderia sp. HP33-1]